MLGHWATIVLRDEVYEQPARVRKQQELTGLHSVVFVSVRGGWPCTTHQMTGVRLWELSGDVHHSIIHIGHDFKEQTCIIGLKCTGKLFGCEYECLTVSPPSLWVNENCLFLPLLAPVVLISLKIPELAFHATKVCWTANIRYVLRLHACPLSSSLPGGSMMWFKIKCTPKKINEGAKNQLARYPLPKRPLHRPRIMFSL